MSRRQLAALVICYLGQYVMGNMAYSLLPVYTVKLGMDESSIGIYLGLAFAAITAGALSSGWFSDRFQRRKLTLILSSAVGIPATLLMGQVSDFALLTLFTLIVWFAAGLGNATVSILAGLHADPQERGRVFGILSSAVALGIALGSFTAGAIVDRWGFAVLYGLAALTWLIPIVAALFIQDSVTTRPPAGQPKPAAVTLSRAIWLLLIANVLIAVTNFSSGFARPLTMNRLGFDASAISSASGISGLVTLPLPFLVGLLSDRIGRRQLLVAGYLLMSLGTLVLVPALNLWQFWASSSLIALAGSAAGVATAFVTDLAEPEALSTALSRFSATPWIGAIIGYVATGLVIQGLGLTTTLLIGATLPVLAILMLLGIRKRVQLVPA